MTLKGQVHGENSKCVNLANKRGAAVAAAVAVTRPVEVIMVVS